MTFSTAWRASKNRSKQRKYRANAPKHIKLSMRSAMLSDELATEHKAKTAPVRVGDEVKIMRGVHAGRTGEVSAIHPHKRERVLIQGFDVIRRDGQKRSISFDASNLMIIEAAEDDRRFAAPMTRKAKRTSKAKASSKASSKATPAATSETTPQTSTPKAPKSDSETKPSAPKASPAKTPEASETSKTTKNPGQQSGSE